MIDHLSIVVSDYATSKRFYLHALAPTGHTRLIEIDGKPGGGNASTGFCHADGSDLWISEGAPVRPPIHVAFRAATRGGG